MLRAVARNLSLTESVAVPFALLVSVIFTVLSIAVAIRCFLYLLVKAYLPDCCHFL